MAPELHATNLVQLFPADSATLESGIVRADASHQPAHQLSVFYRTALGASGDAAMRAEHHMDEIPRPHFLLHVPVPPAEQCENLRLAVERAAERSAESMAALRAAVRDFTLVLRDEGITPEHVLISLKNVIYNRSFPAIAVHPTEWASGSRLHEKISTWCIEEFFSERTA